MTRHGTLLVVDDNDDNRDVLSRRLRQKGFTVTVAADGPEALALIDREAYDLILLDVEMPGMSGLHVLSQLRVHRSQTQLPVIMVTARSEGTDIVEALSLGANDYVTKPIDFPVALARIRTHLAHKWAVADLHESEERYALAVRGANDGLWDWNLVTNEVYWSPRWKAVLGYDDTEIGASPDEWLGRVHDEDVEDVKRALTAHLADGRDHYESEHRILHRNGLFRWVRCRGAAVRDSAGVATRLAGSLTDITETKLADALTGLPNRLRFLDLVERAIKREKRRPHPVFGLLALGLNRFDVVNDSLGPLTADRLLVAVARRLQSSLRPTDTVARDQLTSTLARLGGDEFNVLLDDIRDANDAVRVAERLRRALQEPFDVDGHQVFMSASVGIAISTSGYERPEEALRDATIALNRAKADGTSPCEIFDPAMRQRAVTRLQLETDLRNAIENRAFEVHYQPIISLRTGGITGFEALVRWRHPVRGLVGPLEFIPLAEDTGLITEITRLTITESCRQMVQWQRQFGPQAPGVMCVNVSSKLFGDSELVGELKTILVSTGLEASSLKLEITESAFINDLAAARVTLGHAQAMGIEWSLDDFGTGYSSLSHLHGLQIDTVKIDRSFVSRIGVERHGSEMVRAIVALAHTLGMDVVAEGVETAEQAARLIELGCEYAQGFHYSKAVDAAAAGLLIGSQPWQGLMHQASSTPDDREALFTQG
ncbi:MAG TPA: EAL domain-containing protein [Vicinamibacterales bacterium]|nr:EAL domain-containing protein [Vicinamibacterales bacterium]